MQDASHGPKSAENAANSDETKINQPAYFLRFAIGIGKMREGLAERGGFEPPIELLTL